MSEYMFGVSTKRPTKHVAKIMERVAKENGAYLVEAQLPDGYKRWYCLPRSYGSPFDDQNSKAVLSAVDAALAAQGLTDE